MNRQTKRMMKRDEERRKAVPRPVRAAGAPAKKERTKPLQFVREVIAELRKVAWPTRKEVVGYSLVVLVSSVVVAALIFGEDFVFTKLILGLFGIEV